MNRIRELRIKKGISQSELAESLKITQATISKYELGQRNIPRLFVDKMCEVLNCTSDYLLGISDINAKSPAETSGAGNIPDEFMRLQEANKLYLLLDDAGRAQARAYLEFLVAQQEKQADFQG